MEEEKDIINDTRETRSNDTRSGTDAPSGLESPRLQVALDPAVRVNLKQRSGNPSMTSSQTAFIVTIDGPAASGKSSVSRELARRFGWNWVSTGAFYRGLAYIAYHRKADLTNEANLMALAHSADWSVRMTPERTCVFFDGRDVTDDIGREEFGSLASKISSFPQVRKALLEAQRQCAVGIEGLVAEGRDCGTVVFPTAQLKVFLTARAEDRAARRAREEGREVDALVDEQKKRDAQDANRKAAPMQASADSFVVDTTDMSLTEVIEKVEELVRARQIQPAVEN